MSLLGVLACDWQQWTVYMDCQGTVTVCGLTVIEEIYMNVLSSVLHALAAVYIYIQHFCPSNGYDIYDNIIYLTFAKKLAGVRLVFRM